MSKVRVILSSVAALAFASGSAAAGPASAQSDARNARAPAHHVSVAAPEGAAAAATTMFGDRIDHALAQAGPSAQVVNDPSGRFVVRVAAVPADGSRVLSVTDLGTNKTQEFRLAAHAPEADVRLTISQIMSATGQPTARRNAGTGDLSDYRGK
jgi:hypothetical protein